MFPLTPNVIYDIIISSRPLFVYKGCIFTHHHAAVGRAPQYLTYFYDNYLLTYMYLSLFGPASKANWRRVYEAYWQIYCIASFSAAGFEGRSLEEIAYERKGTYELKASSVFKILDIPNELKD